MLPNQRVPRSRSRLRRAHQAKKPVGYVDCPRCNVAKLPHAACDNCGYVRPGLSLKVEKES